MLSVGFSGTTLVSTLESRYFKLYTQYQHNQYLLATYLIKATGVFAQQPSELKAIVGGSVTTLSKDSNNFTISSGFIRNDYYTMSRIDSFLADYSTTSALNTCFIKLRNKIICKYRIVRLH